jgi:hypothetical protein
MPNEARQGSAAGMAAFGICESLFLALTDLKIINDQDARDLPADVASEHKEAATAAQSRDRHQAVIEIIERILAGKNGMRH